MTHARPVGLGATTRRSTSSTTSATTRCRSPAASANCSRCARGCTATLLDRHRPLWEMHLIEGLADGRFAIYTKIHHALVDGVSALRLLQRTLTEDPSDARHAAAVGDRAARAPASRRPEPRRRSPRGGRRGALRADAGDAAGLLPALARTVSRALREQSGALSFAAPRTMLNVPIAGARRFAAQSWPIERLRQVGKAADATVNDVVLAMCSGALRDYLLEPGRAARRAADRDGAGVAARRGRPAIGDGGNAVGAVMCNLGTDLDDPARPAGDGPRVDAARARRRCAA